MVWAWVADMVDPQAVATVVCELLLLQCSIFITKSLIGGYGGPPAYSGGGGYGGGYGGGGGGYGNPGGQSSWW